ncbi:hypothetical protein LTR09_001197 [Extremus antarcticus]|uniref:Uncharacterized protein n=1 Tax=Extremus antarcticus TaxID=702011 RepID=A0AAJ0GIC7_9PEZI|nr:hypothetical protein LTR09_001197 [Extremus antarcticus]
MKATLLLSAITGILLCSPAAGRLHVPYHHHARRSFTTESASPATTTSRLLDGVVNAVVEGEGVPTTRELGAPVTSDSTSASAEVTPSASAEVTPSASAEITTASSTTVISTITSGTSTYTTTMVMEASVTSSSETSCPVTAPTTTPAPYTWPETPYDDSDIPVLDGSIVLYPDVGDPKSYNSSGNCVNLDGLIDGTAPINPKVTLTERQISRQANGD